MSSCLVSTRRRAAFAALLQLPLLCSSSLLTTKSTSRFRSQHFIVMAPAAVRQSWQVPLEVEQAYYDLVLGGLCLPASEQAKTAGSSLIARLATRRSVKPKNAHTEIVLGQDGMPALAASRLLVNHNPRTSSRRQFNRSTLVGADYRIPLASAGAQAEWEAWVGRLSSADQRTLVRANLIEDTRYAQASLTSWVSVTPAAAAALGPRRVEAPAPSSSVRSHLSLTHRVAELSYPTAPTASPLSSLCRSCHWCDLVPYASAIPSEFGDASVASCAESFVRQGPRPAQEERNTLSAASSASQRVSEGSESSSHGRASLARSASIRKSLAEDTSSSSEDGDDDGDEEEYQDEVAGWAQRRQLGAGSEDDHPILPSAKAIGKRPIPLIKRSESAEEEARASMPPPIIPPSSSALLNNTPAAPVYDRRATSSTLSSLLATGSRSASVASVVTEARPSQKRRASTELDSHRRRVSFRRSRQGQTSADWLSSGRTHLRPSL